jgi:ureidoacrylate peracid hydrolase
MRDYDVVVVTDCVAGVNREWHDAALAVWDYYLAKLVTADELSWSLRSDGYL